ncbi:hypothetical protein D1872_264940 [compost metagenome]
MKRYLGGTPETATSLASMFTANQALLSQPYSGTTNTGSTSTMRTLSPTSTTLKSTPCLGPTIIDGSLLPRWGRMTSSKSLLSTFPITTPSTGRPPPS